MYENYYADQSGSGISVFVCQCHQRGHGLGQTINGLFKRFVIPFVAPRAKEVGKNTLGNVVKTGMEMVGDVVSGRSAKESLKERGLAGIKRYRASVAGRQHQSQHRCAEGEEEEEEKSRRKTE